MKIISSCVDVIRSVFLVSWYHQGSNPLVQKGAFSVKERKVELNDLFSWIQDGGKYLNCLKWKHWTCTAVWELLMCGFRKFVLWCSSIAKSKKGEMFCSYYDSLLVTLLFCVLKIFWISLLGIVLKFLSMEIFWFHNFFLISLKMLCHENPRNFPLPFFDKQKVFFTS